MKRIMSIGLVFCLSFLIVLGMSLKAQASNELEISTGGTASKVAYSQSGNSEVIRIFTPKTQIVKQYVLPPQGSVKNYRLGFEILGANVSKSIKFDVNKGSVVQIRLANAFDPERLSVVVETSKKPNYTLAPSGDGKSVILTLSGGVSSATTAPGNSPKPSAPPASAPKPDTGSSGSHKAISENGPLSWKLSGDTCEVILKGIILSQTNIGTSPRYELRQKEKLLQIILPGRDTRFADGYLSGNHVINGILVIYNKRMDSTIIRISYKNNISYSHAIEGESSVFRIKAGGSVISDTPPSSPPTGSTPPGSSGISPPSSATPSQNEPVAGINLSSIKAGNGDNVALRLVDPGIVNRYRQHVNSIVLDNSVRDQTFAFMIPKSVINLGNGTMNINNGLTRTITTLTSAQNTFLVLEKKDPDAQFEIIEGSNADELLIVAAKKSGKSKLVVLDPGHGGSDPGGTTGQYYEKHYNLDIALKCCAILKSRGINVAMTRTADVYVGLEERAEFANNLNASLFVSIHNNIMPNGYKGSMALYYPTSYSGKSYAQTILNNLVKDLKTNNIGLKANGELVVVNKTKMPAVLAEIACMSDPGDLSLLNTEAFRQKAAESLANSIIQIINSM